jgi:hypothetical protein
MQVYLCCSANRSPSAAWLVHTPPCPSLSLPRIPTSTPPPTSLSPPSPLTSFLSTTLHLSFISNSPHLNSSRHFPQTPLILLCCVRSQEMSCMPHTKPSQQGTMRMSVAKEPLHQKPR